MSLKLLEYLNGDSGGVFNEFLKTAGASPRIAWYPSAGDDFRDLLYLSPAYSKFILPNRRTSTHHSFRYYPHSYEPAPPDIYLHTDYAPFFDNIIPNNSEFLGLILNRSFLSKELVNDRQTRITIVEMEELARIDLPKDKEIIYSDRRSNFETGRVVFLWVEVESSILGTFRCPVLYVFAENEAFCSKLAIPNEAQFSHVIHVRYGGGCGGGGSASGVWIKGVLKRLKCEMFITDGHGNMQSGDECALKLYPNLEGDRQIAMHVIRGMNGRKWSSHGDITFNLIGEGEKNP